MRPLYEIKGDYLRLLEMLEDEGNLDPQAFRDTLEGIEGEFEVKADGYARIMKELDAEAGKYDAEIQRMTARRDSLNNRSRLLKQHLYEGMKAIGKLKFKTDLFSFSIRKNGGKDGGLQIVPGAEIPDEYCRKEPDNAKIREALKNGAELPFAMLKERGDHLAIR